jgi:hypothetical protein
MGLRIASKVWISTSTLSQKPGRVNKVWISTSTLSPKPGRVMNGFRVLTRKRRPRRQC